MIKVRLKKDSYKIEFCSFAQVAKNLDKNPLGQKYAIITDHKVKKLYAESLKKELKKSGIIAEIFSFPSGEKNKTLQTIEKLAEQMLAKEFDRKDAIIALGGGVVGDIAGFLASIYLRGIPFIQIPTTLLAMVDSAVGGKTGVDLESGKNLIGTFNQPKAVYIDPTHLKTLPKNQLRSGLAEVIKYGVIKDKKLFKYLEKNLDQIFALQPQALNHIIERSLEIKAKIVQKDEKESHLRMILNYGHTYGHALEKISNYTLLHGYAISIGMILANQIALDKNLLKPTEAERIKNLLKQAGLPVSTMHKIDASHLKNDKKRSGNKIKFILPTKIGRVQITEITC